MNKTWYIVSGIYRCGTSMMMEAVEAGGLELIYDRTREIVMAKKWEDKEGKGVKPPNKKYYELPKVKNPIDFPHEFVDNGDTLKIFYPNLLHITASFGYLYKIVLMTREPEEIKQSYESRFELSMDTNDRFCDHAAFAQPNFVKDYRKTVSMVYDIIDVRNDCDIVEFDYRTLCDNPLHFMLQLQSRGWPIDPYKAAKIPEPAETRFKIENLETGL